MLYWDNEKIYYNIIIIYFIGKIKQINYIFICIKKTSKRGEKSTSNFINSLEF